MTDPALGGQSGAWRDRALSILCNECFTLRHRGSTNTLSAPATLAVHALARADALDLSPGAASRRTNQTVAYEREELEAVYGQSILFDNLPLYTG
ncbi:MAG: hypothetical protein AMXMBFR76_09320 [Pseudomonadota bacterium]